MNKIDMDSAHDRRGEGPDRSTCIGCEPGGGYSAGLGQDGTWASKRCWKPIVNRIPAPTGDESAPLQALIFDSVFNPFRGIIAYFRVFNGTLRKGDHVKFFNTGSEYDADEVGVLKTEACSPGRSSGPGTWAISCSGHQGPRRT